MKTKLTSILLALSVALAALVATPGCKKLADVNWPEIANCGPGISDLIGVVSRVLLDGKTGWKDEMTDLARVHGTETVICITDRLRADWSADTAAATPERSAALERAEEFIGFTGSKVVREEEPDETFDPDAEEQPEAAE